MEKLFSYGTLQQTEVQIETFGRELYGIKDALVGYTVGEVEITDPKALALPGKRFHPMLIRTNLSTDEVWGTVFEITEHELSQADLYEVASYTRKLGTLKYGEHAWIYANAKDAD